MSIDNTNSVSTNGIVKAICISKEKGTAKHECSSAVLRKDYGIEGDAHAGSGIRQVSLLSLESINNFRAKGACVDFGAFGENLIIEGIDFAALSIGRRLYCGDVVLEISKKGKECHHHCAIFKKMNDCIMPREGIFAIVVHGGNLKTGCVITAA